MKIFLILIIFLFLFNCGVKTPPEVPKKESYSRGTKCTTFVIKMENYMPKMSL